MADVDSQMEANGLPTKFESSPNQPEVSHATSNIAATMSNAEASELKQNAPDLQFGTINKPVEQTETSIMETSQPVRPASDVVIADEPIQPSIPAPAPVPGTSPFSAPMSSTTVNGHRHSPLPEERVPVQMAETSFTESVVPSSIPEEIQSSNATVETAPMAFGAVAEPALAPEQAPLSDLRSEPHSDHLPPAAVAQIEEEKHEIDNKADIVPSTMDAPPSPQPPAEAPLIKNNGLPSPPPQSPPPPPEPEHAVLPAEDVTVPSIESVAAHEAIAPTEQPIEPAPTPVVAEPPAPQDQEMMDVAPAVPKAVREREEDVEMDEPQPKRMKTDEDRELSEQAEFKMPEVPSSTVAQTTASHPVDEDDVVTAPRLAHMKKVISNLKKSNASTPFRVPVDPVALNIPTYSDIVKTPMDLGTIDQKLKQNEYASVKDFVHDFSLIVANCVAFNGPEHSITQQGRKMESSFANQMQNLPPASAVEPSKAEKKAAKPKIEPVRSAPRRTSVTAKAASPSSATSPATFAPGPDGVPLIRRDSAVDGRPKRAIVPPKRNSDFTGARPKKKKYELQLRFCDEVLKTIMQPKHWQMNQYFTHPVDPVALNIPTYFQIIKKPMDLGTVRQKLDGGMYEKAKDFEEDVRLVFKNCYKFNLEGDFVYQKGRELEELFSKEWEKKDDWIAAREPESEPTSVVDDEQDDDEASDDDEDGDSDDERNDKIKALQAQIEAMSKQMGELTQKKKKPTPPAGSKKSGKSGKPKSKEKSSNPFPNLSKKKDKEKKKPSSKSKPEKDRYVTFAEKQYISNGIAMLPERQMQEALKIIQSSVPALANSDQNEIELDIEEVPNHALLKLLNFVKKYAGPPPDEPKVEAESYSVPASSSKPKKSKPMSKHEQEAQIAELKGKLENYATGGSPDAAGTGADSSDESDSGEESEEE